MEKESVTRLYGRILDTSEAPSRILVLLYEEGWNDDPYQVFLPLNRFTNPDDVIAGATFNGVKRSAAGATQTELVVGPIALKPFDQDLPEERFLSYADDEGGVS